MYRFIDYKEHQKIKKGVKIKMENYKHAKTCIPQIWEKLNQITKSTTKKIVKYLYKNGDSCISDIVNDLNINRQVLYRDIKPAISTNIIRHYTDQNDLRKTIFSLHDDAVPLIDFIKLQGGFNYDS